MVKGVPAACIWLNINLFRNINLFLCIKVDTIIECRGKILIHIWPADSWNCASLSCEKKQLPRACGAPWAEEKRDKVGMWCAACRELWAFAMLIIMGVVKWNGMQKRMLIDRMGNDRQIGDPGLKREQDQSINRNRPPRSFMFFKL